MKNQPVEFGGQIVSSGQAKTIHIPLSHMVTHNDLTMTCHVVNGKKPGPTLFICAAIHGDEINGVEIIRRFLRQKQLSKISGTIVAIPIVNVHGFMTHSRYLPDGRDLNRNFPGSSKGSLTSRVADTFFKEVVKKCSHGVDLHTGARHRENLPQVRVDMDNEQAKEMALKFGVPAVIDSKIRDGSLREAAGDMDIPVVLYEAGEALRFNEVSIRAGVRGILNVMRQIGMLHTKTPRPMDPRKAPTISSYTAWLRAPISGVFRTQTTLGAKAEKGSILGIIADPLGESEYPVIAPSDGMVIGRTNLPLVYEGDALFHLAYYGHKVDHVIDQVEDFRESIETRTEPDIAHEIEQDFTR